MALLRGRPPRLRRRRREYAARQMKLAKSQQSKDYWESEWKRDI